MIRLPVDYEKLDWGMRKQVREQYVEKQNGLCYFCKKPLKKKPVDMIKKYKINYNLFPDNFFKHPVHLHHDHTTGLTIGAVHAHCNAVLWQYMGE